MMRPLDTKTFETIRGVMAAGLLFILLRFGLLALMFALFFVLLLTSYPITYNGAAWYLDSSLFALVVAAGLALYGGYVSLGGRPLLQPELAPR